MRGFPLTLRQDVDRLQKALNGNKIVYLKNECQIFYRFHRRKESARVQFDKREYILREQRRTKLVKPVSFPKQNQNLMKNSSQQHADELTAKL